ncbi:DUF2812 domain-containing protein [Pediococcus ethanolidurans]|uniref:DUF2812 domain-containing protein n=1 Tax=Pediococcus ethanolidurans TaxID=319653 RepID=UPI002953A619|nr:DUF2812 domain-containing protein [Pediococcus ethanolidurans]MDV7719994.1 DUF2812 domain-containing protein [Pediococcus ethanolidurans]
MRKLKLVIKGSEKEQQWLNSFSKKGWSLSHVGKISYTFKPGKKPSYILTNYSREQVNEKSIQKSDVKLLQNIKVNKPDFFVQYYSTTDSRLDMPKEKSDIVVSGQIANALKNKATLLQMIWTVIGFLSFLGRLFYLSVKHISSDQHMGMLGNFASSNLFWILFIVWFLIFLIILWTLNKFRKLDASYRMQTKNYQGTYLPNKYVEINTKSKTFNTQLFADLGNWRLVTNDGNGSFYYRLQTIFSNEEIIKQIKAKSSDVEDVKVTKWLGAFYLPIG